MLLKISVVILFFYSLCELFFYYDFDIEVIDVNDRIFIKTFNKYRMFRNFCGILRFLLQNTNEVYALWFECYFGMSVVSLGFERTSFCWTSFNAQMRDRLTIYLWDKKKIRSTNALVQIYVLFLLTKSKIITSNIMINC